MLKSGICVGNWLLIKRNLMVGNYIVVLNLTNPYCRFCELAEQHHPKDLLSVEEFLLLRKQVVTNPAKPLTVASCTDDDDDTVDTAAAEDLTDELPPGVDDQPGSDASSDNKSKVYIRSEFSQCCTCTDTLCVIMYLSCRDRPKPISLVSKLWLKPKTLIRP